MVHPWSGLWGDDSVNYKYCCWIILHVWKLSYPQQCLRSQGSLPLPGNPWKHFIRNNYFIINRAATSENVPLDMCPPPLPTPSKALDQTVHMRSLIKIFPGCILYSQGCNISSCGQWRLWSDCAKVRLIWVFTGYTCCSSITVASEKGLQGVYVDQTLNPESLIWPYRIIWYSDYTNEQQGPDQTVWMHRILWVLHMLDIVHNIKENWHAFRRDNSVKIVLPPFWKGVYFKMKEFAPTAANSFLIE